MRMLSILSFLVITVMYSGIAIAETQPSEEESSCNKYYTCPDGSQVQYCELLTGPNFAACKCSNNPTSLCPRGEEEVEEPTCAKYYTCPNGTEVQYCEITVQYDDDGNLIGAGCACKRDPSSLCLSQDAPSSGGGGGESESLPSEPVSGGGGKPSGTYLDESIIRCAKGVPGCDGVHIIVNEEAPENYKEILIEEHKATKVEDLPEYYTYDVWLIPPAELQKIVYYDWVNRILRGPEYAPGAIYVLPNEGRESEVKKFVKEQGLTYLPSFYKYESEALQKFNEQLVVIVPEGEERRYQKLFSEQAFVNSSWLESYSYVSGGTGSYYSRSMFKLFKVLAFLYTHRFLVIIIAATLAVSGAIILFRKRRTKY